MEEERKSNAGSSSSSSDQPATAPPKSSVAAFLEQLEQRRGEEISERPPFTVTLREDEEVTLPGSVRCLTSRNGGRVFLVGTAHVSSKSVEEVRQVIQSLRPNTVFIELCKSRVGILYAQEAAPTQSSSLSFAEIKELFKQQKGMSALLHLALSQLFRKVMDKIKVTPGAEFKAAAEEGSKVGARIVLGDRPIEITLQRTWRGLSKWEKLKLMYLLLKDSSLDITEEDVERLKNSDIITELAVELGQHFPSLVTHIIHERDLYMAAALRQCPGDVVVAVVGMGHCAGMEKAWEEDINMPALLHTADKAKSSWKRVWGGAFLVACLAATSYYCYYYLCC
ncbi:TraB domain-containing protein [Balamuthia mandrillaris]